ncbi:MAG: hypothetical protein ACREDG_01375, partial [Methylocella sp.]
VSPFARQSQECAAAPLAFFLENRVKFRAAVDLYACDFARRRFGEFVEQSLWSRGFAVARDIGGGPFGDRIIGGDGLDGVVRTDVYEQRSDLDAFAGNLGLSPFWQAPGIPLLRGVTEAPACRFTAQARNGRDRAACGEIARMRPVVATERTTPLRLSSTAILRLPHIG